MKKQKNKSFFNKKKAPCVADIPFHSPPTKSISVSKCPLHFCNVTLTQNSHILLVYHLHLFQHFCIVVGKTTGYSRSSFSESETHRSHVNEMATNRLKPPEPPATSPTAPRCRPGPQASSVLRRHYSPLPCSVTSVKPHGKSRGVSTIKKRTLYSFPVVTAVYSKMT